MGVEVPSNPINRKEQYLAKIAGQAVEIPAEPLTREEAYLDQIAKNGSGGGGGTTNYNLLSNKPQIAGTELQGNKSLADLGIASAQSVSDITNGESINNFADVETALSNKQGKLTAGSHIDISNNEVSVNRYVNPAGDIIYRAVTVNATTAYVDKYTSGGTFIERINITANTYQSQDVESKIRFYREFDGWVITLLANSKEHNAGYSYSARTSGSGAASQNDFTFTISQTLDDNDLIIRSELATKQDTLTFDNAPTDGSNNPVKSNGIYDALALKQNATDNNLDTDEKTIVGAINEHEGDITSLKRGLIDVNNNILSLVSIETQTTNSDTASANGGRLGLTCSTARVGYTALGIVGVTIINNQSTVENGVCLGLAFIDDSGNVQISARNYTSASITALAKVDIIYIKNS